MNTATHEDRAATPYAPGYPFQPSRPGGSVPDDPDGPLSWPPKKIYEYLDGKVWKQDEAKQAAAMLAYNALNRGIKTNAFFVGPTGCGKTHIWRCLQELYPQRIVIVDASSLTQDGWKGATKWGDLLRDPILQMDKPSILVMDEADKFLIPRYTSYGENVSHGVASEGLKILEGTCVELTGKGYSTIVDTTLISFVCCGAFSERAAQLVKSQQKIGFGGVVTPPAAYEKPLTERDLLDYGVMPEFLGRIQQVVNLAPMTEEDYFRMLDSPTGPIARLESRYRVEICLTEAKRRELAELAANSGLGVRGVESQLRRLLDNALFEDHTQRSLAF